MDKIIVITGGTSGIGLDLKTLFEGNGDTVLTVSSREMDDSKHYSCNLANELKVKQVINGIGQTYGKIDMLINCAGIGMSAITELVPTDDIRKLVDINYYGTLYTIRSAIEFMSEGSKIVNISSAMALFPVPFRSIYGSLKAAILNLSYSLRMELKPLGIDVVAFCPGDIKTNFTKNRLKDSNTSERYGDRLQTATEKSDSREEKRIPSMVCATAIFKKLQKQKCKPMYIVGGKYKFLYFLTRITPKSWLLGVTGKIYGGDFVAKSDQQKKSQVSEENPIDEVVQPVVGENNDNPFAGLAVDSSLESDNAEVIENAEVENENASDDVPDAVENVSENLEVEQSAEVEESPIEEVESEENEGQKENLEEKKSSLFAMIDKMKK